MAGGARRPCRPCRCWHTPKRETHLRTCSSLWPSRGNDDGRQCWPLRALSHSRLPWWSLRETLLGVARMVRRHSSRNFLRVTPGRGRVVLLAFWTWIETVCFHVFKKKKSDRPNQRRSLEQRMGDHSIRRSFRGSKSGGPQLWAQQRGKMGGGCGMPSGTQRELSEELAGGSLKSMGMSRC